MSLNDLRNIGPVSKAMLREAGIATGPELRELGAALAYRQVKFHCGGRVSVNLLWALYGALNEVDWRTLDKTTKDLLKREAGL